MSKVCIALLTKDCDKYIAKVLKNVEAYASCFKSAQTWIVDGYSKDMTEIICKSWCKSDPQNRTFVKQPTPNLFRGESLREARNYVLELTKPHWGPNTYLLLLDADSPNAVPADISGFMKGFTSMQETNISALFVNQRNIYYDLWALRDAELAEDYQIKFAGKNWNGEMQEAIAPYQKPKSAPSDLWPVQSAFGGAAIYRTIDIEDAKYECFCILNKNNQKYKVQICEHVPFHEHMIKRGKKLFVNCVWYNGEHE